MLDKILNCMICSAMDEKTKKVRNEIVNVMTHWNSINSKCRKISYVPLGQGINTVPGVGKSAQAVIDKQSVKESDFAILIFNTSRGTSTEKADSGTLDELDSFLKIKKPIYVFIKASKEMEDIKKQIQAKKTVFYEKYKSISELKTKIRDVLDITANSYSEKQQKSNTKTIQDGQLAYTIRNDQYANIYRIIKNASKGISVSEILPRTNFSRQKVNYIIKDLESKGFISSTRELKTLPNQLSNSQRMVNTYSIIKDFS